MTSCERRTIAELFKSIFFSVFGLVCGFLALRALRRLFDRLDGMLDDRRGTLQPVVFFRIPVFSGEAVGGAFALAVSIGRIVAYVVAAVATFVLVMSQFELTRPFVKRLANWALEPVLGGLEALITSIPGLLLAAILILLLRGGLRVLNLLLDGVQHKRVKWKRLPPEKVPPFRLIATTVLIVLVAPGIVAAVFGWVSGRPSRCSRSASG